MLEFRAALGQATAGLFPTITITGQTGRQKQTFGNVSVPGSAGAFTVPPQNYLQALFGQISQAAACNRLHSNEERLSRWLLMSHDRVGTETFPITHEFLGQMLGSRRATVTLSAGILQAAGLIRYPRGRVTIVDRAGLESVSCECYGVIKAALDRVIESADSN